MTFDEKKKIEIVVNRRKNLKTRGKREGRCVSIDGDNVGLTWKRIRA